MWIIDKIYDALVYIGLLQKRAKILFLGLDEAGKSTLLLRIITNDLYFTGPTEDPTSTELLIGNNLRCTTFDLSGAQESRHRWRDFFAGAGGVVFVVDARETERLDEARRELQGLLAADELRDVPFLVLGNKIDIPFSVSETELRGRLGVGRGTRRQPLEVFMCSAVQKLGYGIGLRWLAQHVLGRRDPM
ncbi:small COPII coat GTPase sar1 [Annulohypoxylon truncatum]|uniref:small COPII coat GTPase sar1 n=1 Tax=Annulohypoxylon truncatum TaxID=327061 RepID=UPI002008D3D1|nr:small COPII coat GTPase sar1 [Annulohypoxylon truncatum]KAI1208513.1 small COPII coat GTPase sar1 [Annulohypoxylon truncatum]